MNLNIVSLDSNVVTEVNGAKKIKTKGADFENISAKGVPTVAPVQEAKHEEMWSIGEAIEAAVEPVVQAPVFAEEVKVDDTVVESAPESEKRVDALPEWREPDATKKQKSTVIEAPTNISLVDSTRETYVGLRNKLNRDEDPIQYAVVNNGLAMVDQKEHEKELLIEKRDSGRNECEGMISSKESDIRELTAKYEAELAALEQQLESLKANGESYLKSMDAKIKTVEGQIIEIYKTMKVELSKAEKADTKTKEANTLRAQQTEIVGSIGASFLKGITEPESSQTPVSIKPFDAYRVEEGPRRAA